VLLVLMWIVRLGEKRWRDLGMDLDGKEHVSSGGAS
jgi:hypothetical protein